MSSIKERKIAIIKKEILIKRGQSTYDISGIDVGSAKFFYRFTRQVFNDLAQGDYTIAGSKPNYQLVISNPTIINTAEAIQICEIYDTSSSKYIVPFEADINTLVAKYNEAVDDIHRLWSYTRMNGLIADETSMPLIMPQLDEDEIWVKTLDGWKGYPIHEFEQDVQGMLDELERLRQQYLSELLSTKNKYVIDLTNHKNTLVEQATDDMTTQANNKKAEIITLGNEWNRTVVATGDEQNTRIVNQGDTQNARIISTGGNQVKKVKDEGDTQFTRVNNAGNTQVGRVTNEGNSQVTKVINEGTSQFNKITTKGGEVISQIESMIPDNLSSRVDVLEGDITDVKGDVTTLKGQVTTAQGDIGTLKTDVQNINNNEYKIKYKEIPDGTNLNTILEAGHYRSNLSSDIINNSPIGEGAFTLRVENIQGNTQYANQILRYYNDNIEYSRHTWDGGTIWTSWASSIFAKDGFAEIQSQLVIKKDDSMVDKIVFRNNNHDIMTKISYTDSESAFRISNRDNWGDIMHWTPSSTTFSNQTIIGDTLVVNKSGPGDMIMQEFHNQVSDLIYRFYTNTDSKSIFIWAPDGGWIQAWTNYNVNIYKNTNIQGDLTVTGSITSNNNITAYSDRKLKTNIKPLENTLELISKLDVYNYDWKKNGRHDIGVIAQEVEEVFPEFVVEVDTKEDGKVKTVDYGKLATISLKAVKELNQKYEDILARLEKLEGGR